MLWTHNLWLCHCDQAVTYHSCNRIVNFPVALTLQTEFVIDCQTHLKPVAVTNLRKPNFFVSKCSSFDYKTLQNANKIYTPAGIAAPSFLDKDGFFLNFSNYVLIKESANCYDTFRQNLIKFFFWVLINFVPDVYLSRSAI